jgi:hypothetical protein
MNDTAELEAVGERGLIRAQERYSWAKNLEKLHGLIQKRRGE